MTSAQCASCKHYDPAILACKAFPNGIPELVLSGQIDHTNPVAGDRGIRYEEATDAEIAERNRRADGEGVG